jgi:hypothetical protein
MSMQLLPSGHQARWDETLGKINLRADAQRSGESEIDYLRRLAIRGKKYLPRSEDIVEVKFSRNLPDNKKLHDRDVLRYSEMVRQAVERNITRVDNMDRNDPTYREVMVTDDNTGQKIKTFYRARPFTDDFAQPCRQVRRIINPSTGVQHWP